MGELMHEHAAVGQLARLLETADEILGELRRGQEWGGADHIEQATWTAGQSYTYSHDGSFAGFMILNLTDAEMFVGLSPQMGKPANGGGAQPGAIAIEGRGVLTLPVRGTYVDVGGTAAGRAVIIPLAISPPPFAGNLGLSQRGDADSLNGSGRVVAPGAGQVIATTPAGVAGAVYEIFVAVSVGAGGLAADAGNMQLQEGATVLDVLAVPAPGGVTFGPIRRTNVGAAAYSVNATGAGTAAVPYAATITATRLS